MNIIICGAGEVGSHSAEVLQQAGHTITVIDVDPVSLERIEDSMDVAALEGDCASAEVLQRAGARHADLIIAATNHDEVNLVSASVAKALGTKKAIARIHHRAFLSSDVLDYEAHFDIDELICPEFSTATAIARALRNPAAVAIEHFARGKIDMQELTVGKDASAIGKSLIDLHLPQGTRLAAVTRDDEVFIPDATTVIAKGDRIVLVGNTDVFDSARNLFLKKDSGKRKVVIMGGGPMAVWLCRALHVRNWSIRVFETNRELAEEIAEKLDWVTVIEADPTDRSVFQEENIGQADIFVALLDDDEANIIGCVLAKSMGVTQVIAVVQKANYLDLLYHIGVDRPFSPRMVAVREIQHVIDDSPLKLITALVDGFIDAYQIDIPDNSPAIEKRLRDIKLSPDWVLVAIRRGDEVWVPTADDRIQIHDTVLVIGKHGMEKNLTKILGVR